MSTPLAFSLSASAMTAAVGEIWIRLMRSVSCTSLLLRLMGKYTSNSLQAGRSRANTELAWSPGGQPERAAHPSKILCVAKPARYANRKGPGQDTEDFTGVAYRAGFAT